MPAPQIEQLRDRGLRSQHVLGLRNATFCSDAVVGGVSHGLTALRAGCSGRSASIYVHAVYFKQLGHQ